MSYTADIIATAVANGVTPAIALAVARRESGINQYRPDGSLLIGSAGEIGIFQVKPSSAPGVDLTDPQQNIQAGVGYLASLHRRFGSWPLAIAAYNWGPGRVQDAMGGKLAIPGSVTTYVNAVLGSSGQLSAGTQITPGKLALGAIFSVALLILVLK
ncbi:MAG: hypothetical protein CXZ00_02950 [Acidobacteria bacterium]|nr:MAG: hypothetical protein CXZ00_02950 [Acidobacteriota bacterium]